MELKKKIALVTGSGRGIGKAIALRLAQDGVHIIVNFFRNRKSAEDTASLIHAMGQQATIIKANIGDLEQLTQLFQTIDDKFGRLDILINNAATGYNRPVLEQKPKGWDWTLNVNARAVLFGAQHAMPLMKKSGGGHIVNITSMGSQKVLPDYVVVGASKAALESLTRYLAVELAEHNIIVNAVSPGMTLTDALQNFRQLQENLDTTLKIVEHNTPAGRLVEPKDVAEVVAFLCSSGACMIRGQVIVVDGGYTIAQNLGRTIGD